MGQDGPVLRAVTAFLFIVFLTSFLLFCLLDSSAQGLKSNRQMSFEEVPVIDNTFSLPQNVFEGVWAQSRQQVSNVLSPAASLHQTATSTQRYTPAVQSRRPSDDYVTDLTGNEAKRPRVSLSQQDFTHQMHHQKDQQEQLKLQMIMERLNRTRDKVLKLLKLQKARALLNRYENPAGRSAEVVKSQPRHVLLNRNISTPSNFHGTVQDSVPNLSSQSQRARLVPGINIVSNGTEQGTNEYSYDTLESAGLALDHQTLPKLVAVHSVVKDPSVAVNRCVTTDSHSLVGVATSAHRECIITSGPSVRTGLHESCQPAYVHKTRDVRQFWTHPPLPGETTARGGSLQNCEDEEIILTKVIPGNKRLSTRTSPYVEKTQDGVDLAKCNEETERNDKEQHSPGNIDNPRHSGLGHAMSPKNVDHLQTVDHPGNSDYPGYSIIPANVNHAEAVNHPGDVHRSEQEQHSGSLESSNTDSDVYLGGPPPYLPVLSTFEMIEREKEASQQSSEKNPTSPRLTKTVPEISEKIVETRERIKNETINWKKCFLVKVEKRLIQKLRRAEHLTGEKTEIEDLRQEVQERVTKRNRSKDQGKDKTLSRQESVTGDVTGDADDTMGSGGQERRSSQDSVTESVTDDDGDNAVEPRDTERTASRGGGLTGVKVGDMDVAVEDHAGSVTESVKESDNSENAIECLHSEGTTSRQGSLSEEMTSDAHSAAESNGQKRSSSHDCPTENVTSGVNCIKVECHRQEEKNCGQEDNLMNSDGVKGHANLQKQEKNDGQTKAIQNVDTSRDEKVIVEHCENFTDVITEDKEKSVIRLTKDEEVQKNMEKQFNTSENQRNIKSEASERVDCVKTEHLQEPVAPQLKRKSESLERKKPEFTGCGDVKKARNEKATLDVQHSQDKKECVIPKSDETKKIQAVCVRSDNIFETFSSKVCVTDSIKANQPNVPGVTIEALAAVKKTSGESNVALSKNIVSLKKKLQSCSKQALEVKPKTVDCERNIWSTLRKKGIF